MSSLVTLNKILPQARKELRGVGAFNVANLETVLSVYRAAVREKSPVIIQVYQRLFNDERAAMIAGMTERLAAETDIPIALHLDHGESIDQIRKAISLGYTSVMFDGSKYPLEKNIELSAEAAAIAHDAGVTIEAEIGHVPFGEGVPELSTASEAAEFIEKTGVDALAVSVGTAHGFYKCDPELDIERLKEISECVSQPLVLHGGTGVPVDELKKAIACGVAKINIATELQNFFVRQVAAEIETNGDAFKPVDLYFKPVEEKLTDFIAAKIKSFS
ncbi:MAG: class II fructose-bisphosphate aldolase [Kiritimatiellia bacterium]